MIDLRAELVEALGSADGRRAIADAIGPVVADAVRRALEEREADRLLDTNALAALLSKTPRALRAQLRRGSELAGLAVVVDRKKLWRHSDVIAHLARKR